MHRWIEPAQLEIVLSNMSFLAQGSSYSINFGLE